MAVLATEYSVELQTHEVSFGYDHLSILITPLNQTFTDNDNDDRADQDCLFVERPDGSFALSLGGGPQNNNPLNLGNLVGDLNRPRDIEVHSAAQRHALVKPSAFPSTREWVDALVRRTVGYPDNLEYELFPDAGENEHNSNSFIAGLLRATGTVVADPASIFADGDYPGYELPVPSVAFTPSRSVRTDLIFVIDTTSSMEDDIEQAKRSATEIIQRVSQSSLNGQDARIAIIDYRDFPMAPYGEAGDYPFNDVLPFSCSAERAIQGINSLTLGSGGDIRESVYSGLMHAIDAESIGSWRGTTVDKRIIQIGDAPPHDPEPNTGFTASSVAAAAQAGGVAVGSGEAEFVSAALAVAEATSLDVSLDGVVTPLDVLLVVNGLNDNEDDSYSAQLDTNRDGLLSPLDVLRIVNYLNATPSQTSSTLEGEGTSVNPIQIYSIVIGSDSGAIDSFRVIAESTGGQAFRATGADDFVETLLEAIDAVAGVENAAPGELLLSHNAQSVGNVSQGEQVHLEATFADPDVDDTHQVTVDWGDGSVETFTTNEGGFSLAKSYASGGRFPISVSVADAAGETVAADTQAFITGIGMMGGTLFVVGTNRNDTVNIFPVRDQVHTVAVLAGRFEKKQMPFSTLSSIEVYGGGGDDFLHLDFNLALPAMLNGGDGRDKLYGGKGNDVLDGGDGEDMLFGFLGDDILRGGNHADFLYGFKGNDLLDGGDGADHLFGEQDDDELIGSGGNDFLYGGIGNDLLRGMSGRDYLYGESGNDQLFGGDDDDWLFGGSGDDLLDGELGNDRVYGESGNNTVR